MPFGSFLAMPHVCERRAGGQARDEVLRGDRDYGVGWRGIRRYGFVAMESDTYPDTGFSRKDFSPEENRREFERIMALSGRERSAMGLSMLAAEKESILAAMPAGLTEAERKRRLYESLYGEPLPPDFP